MAKTTVDLSQFEFNGKTLMAYNELIAEKMLEIDDIKKAVTIFDDVVFNEELGYIGEGGLIGKAGNVCKPESDTFQVPVRRVLFEPKPWSARLEICFTDFNTTCAVYAMKKGVKVSDLTGTDIEDVLIECVARAMQKFLWRLFFFNDTAIKVQGTENGTLSIGENVQYWNIIDGFFKQIDVRCTENIKQKVSISANQGTSYANQKLSKDDIDGILEDLYFNASMVLRDQPDQVIICTQSFADAYRKHLSSTGELESMLRNYENGVQTLTYQGVTLAPFKIFDEIIAKHFNTGTKLINPHRAIYTTKSVLAAAMDSLESFSSFNMWYENKDKEVYVDLAGKACANLLNPELFMYAG